MSFKKRFALYASLAGAGIASYLGGDSSKIEAQEPKEPVKMEKQAESLPGTYLGVPLTGINTVNYMGSKYTPTYRTEDGNIIKGNTQSRDILSDTKIGASETLLNKSKQQGDKEFSERFFKSEIYGASIYYSREKNGGPVYFDMTSTSLTESTIKEKSGDKINQKNNIERSLDSLTFYVNNQDDLAKLQKFCLVNMGNAISADNIPLKNREKALRDLGSLFELTAAPNDARLNSLPGTPSRTVLSESEMNDFHKRIQESLKKHVASERKGNGPALEPVSPKRPLPEGFLPNRGRG